ncbi:hypothetical protein [Orientia tsutsugamushi]|uniref:hypothetical protein n=1 Tax=Orientia tsutsugamushi TaxID=784 RepID=UPI0009B5B4C1|nr:hypothetical protein [Orientia tsutsugamushi]
MLIKVKAITGFLRMIFVNSGNLLLELTDSAFGLSFSSKSSSFVLLLSELSCSTIPPLFEC